MPEDRLDEFARKMGSPKGVDPIPPEQYLTFLNPDDPPLQQLLAWVRSKTIRLGHRSPFCVDRDGHALTIADLCKDRGWDRSNAVKYWREAEIRGLVRREGDKLFLCGKVEPEQSPLPLPPPKQVEPKTGIAARLTSEQFELFRKWNKEKRDSFQATLAEADAYAKKLQAEAIAAARSASEELEDRIFAAHDLPKKRIAKRRPAPEALRVEIQSAPESLWHFVQSREIEQPALCTKSENPLCTKSVSLLTYRGVLQRDKTTTPTPPEPEDKQVVVARPVFEYAETLGLFRSHFSSASEVTVDRLVKASRRAIETVGIDPSQVTDLTLRDALQASIEESPDAKGPGWFLKSVPPILVTSLKNGTVQKKSPVRSRDFADRMFDIGKQRYAGD